MASEALDPNSPAYDPIFAERVRRARENPEQVFLPNNAEFTEE